MLQHPLLVGRLFGLSCFKKNGVIAYYTYMFGEECRKQS